MYLLNKAIGYLTNPVSLMWIGASLSLVLRVVGRKRVAGALLVLSVAWTWLWAMPLMSRVVGAPLERPYLADGRIPAIERCADAAAIVLHGGSMGDDSGIGGCGEMWTSADRVRTAARLWKAGKAPVIFVTGAGCPNSTMGLLQDFGVPTNAMIVSEGPRNTEEEARFVADAAKRLVPEKPNVLVVTSAWHMKRTMLMYEKYAPGVEAMPAPCDFENLLRCSGAFHWGELLPSDEALVANRVSLHEWVGYFGYRYFR